MFCQRLDFIHVVDKCKFNCLKKFVVTRNNTVLSECMSMFKQTADCSRVYVQNDACIGDMVNNNTIYLIFYEHVMSYVDVVSVIYISWCLLSVCLFFRLLL